VTWGAELAGLDKREISVLLRHVVVVEGAEEELVAI